MGLLDAVIGALAGGPSASGGGGQADLLRVVVGMLANGGGAPAGGGGGGGLGGLLGAALGGASAGAPAMGGGVGELVAKFQQAGLGDVIGSWIGTGQNAPISPDRLTQVLGRDTVGNIAGQLGMSQGDAAGQLSRMLPEVLDRLTPQGRVPDGGLGSAGDLLGQLMGR